MLDRSLGLLVDLAGVDPDLRQQRVDRIVRNHQQRVQQVHWFGAGVAVGQCESQRGGNRIAAHGGQFFSVHQVSA
ncbi:hypothetical protein SDC9_103110 [bioreactor metagenome]|uniref:Uncharacterized protein n=1 Tax=bioreactor metagenome TaxID=1076179 RepID=A0A645AU70_9ZZZZ